MATIIKQHGVQTVLSADFTFGFTTGGSDGVNSDGLNNSGALLPNGSAMLPSSLTLFSASGANSFDVLTLPLNSEIITGDVNVLIAVATTATSTIQVGDYNTTARYLGATSIKSAARTALVPTGYLTQGEPLRLTVTNADATGTAGQVKVSVQFIVKNRITENVKTYP